MHIQNGSDSTPRTLPILISVRLWHFKDGGVTRTRANVLYRTRANIDEYWTRANVFISDQGQRFWIFWNIPIYRTRANTQNENIGLGPTLWPRVHSRVNFQVENSRYLLISGVIMARVRYLFFVKYLRINCIACKYFRNEKQYLLFDGIEGWMIKGLLIS